MTGTKKILFSGCLLIFLLRAPQRPPKDHTHRAQHHDGGRPLSTQHQSFVSLSGWMIAQSLVALLSS